MLRVINGGRSKRVFEELYAEARALDVAGEFGKPMGDALRHVSTFRQQPQHLQEIAGELLRLGHAARKVVAEAQTDTPTADERDLRATIDALVEVVNTLGKRLLEHGLLLFDPDYTA